VLQIQLEYHKLVEVCDTNSLEFTDEISQLEKETGSQAKFTNIRLQYPVRSQSVLLTLVQSLVKSICYPEEFSYTYNSTYWGLNIAR